MKFPARDITTALGEALEGYKVMVIWENDDIAITYHDNGADLLIVSFSEMDRDWKAYSTPGKRVFEKMGASYIGVHSKKNHWYPTHSMPPNDSEVGDICQGFPHVIAYGHSMGGYACIRYSKLFRSKFNLSLSPQFSIEPAFVDGWDARYDQFYRLNQTSMDFSLEDVSGNTVVLFDPKVEPDRRHAIAFQDRIGAYLIPMFYDGHETLKVIAHSETMIKIFQLTEKMDAVKLVKNTIRYRRKGSAYHKSSLFKSVARHRYLTGRSQSALVYIDQSLELMPNDIQSLFIKIEICKSLQFSRPPPRQAS